MPPSMPVYYTVSGSEPRPVPGKFFGQATATTKEDAVAKVKSSKLSFPDKQLWGTTIQGVGSGNAFVVKYQNGGKRRKSKRGGSKSRSGRKTRRNKTRRSRGKKIGLLGF